MTEQGRSPGWAPPERQGWDLQVPRGPGRLLKGSSAAPGMKWLGWASRNRGLPRRVSASHEAPHPGWDQRESLLSCGGSQPPVVQGGPPESSKVIHTQETAPVAEATQRGRTCLHSPPHQPAGLCPITSGPQSLTCHPERDLALERTVWRQGKEPEGLGTLKNAPRCCRNWFQRDLAIRWLLPSAGPSRHLLLSPAPSCPITLLLLAFPPVYSPPGGQSDADTVSPRARTKALPVATAPPSPL